MEEFLEDIRPRERRITRLLNFLTILTFIGCGLLLYQLLDAYFNSEENIIKQQNALAQPDFENASEFLRDAAGKSLQMAQIYDEKKEYLIIMGISGIIFCIAGAWLMRKLLKTGFYIYLLGETVPMVISGIWLGEAILHPFVFVQILVQSVFIALYASQLKLMRWSSAEDSQA